MAITGNSASAEPAGRAWQLGIEDRRLRRHLSGIRRAFNIDIETCPICAGAVRIIACIEDPEVIAKILTHLDAKAAESEASRRPP